MVTDFRQADRILREHEQRITDLENVVRTLAGLLRAQPIGQSGRDLIEYVAHETNMEI